MSLDTPSGLDNFLGFSLEIASSNSLRVIRISMTLFCYAPLLSAGQYAVFAVSLDGHHCSQPCANIEQGDLFCHHLLV